MHKMKCFLDFEFATESTDEIGHELISLGAVFVNDELTPVQEYYSLVQPKVNSTISTYCTDLTGITQEMTSNAPSFESAITEFESVVMHFKEMGNKLDFCVWGDFDKRNLRNLMKGYEYTGLFKQIVSNLINIQPEISKSILYEGRYLRKQWGLAKMINIYNLEGSYTHHNALSDAKVLSEIYIANTLGKDVNYDFLKEVIIEDEIKRKERAAAVIAKCSDMYKSIESTGKIVCNNLSEEILKAFEDIISHNSSVCTKSRENEIIFKNNGLLLSGYKISSDKYLNGMAFISLDRIKITLSPSKNDEFSLEDDFELKFTISISENGNEDAVQIDYFIKLNRYTYKIIRRYIRMWNNLNPDDMLIL